MRDFFNPKRIVDNLSNGSMVVGAAVLLLVTLLITLSVMMRYLFNSPIFFTEEVACYCLLGMVFLGLGYITKTYGHIRVNFLFNRIPRKSQGVVEIVFLVLALAFSFVILAGGIILVKSYIEAGTRAWTALRTPLVLPGLLIPIGTAVMILQTVKEIYSRFR